MLTKGHTLKRRLAIIKWQNDMLCWCQAVSFPSQLALTCHDGRYRVYTWVQNHGLLFSKADLGTTTADCLYLLTVETNGPLIWHHSPDRPASHLVACWWHWASSIVEGKTLILTKIDTNFGSAFPTHNASASTTMCHTQDALSTVTQFHASDQRIHFTAKDVQH